MHKPLPQRRKPIRVPARHTVPAVILILLIAFPAMIAAQDSDDPAIEIEWDITSDLYGFGDQIFIISLGVVLPTVFISNGDVIDHKFTPPVGGTGSLSYNFYLNSRFFVGAELSGFFIHTLRGNTLFVIPLGLRAGTQFIIGRFEFPIALTVGMCWHNYLTYSYYGFYLKGGVGAYFRATNDWSFGLAADWSWFPEWTNDPRQNVDGNFAGLLLTARYHF